MKRYALVVKEDEVSKEVANSIHSQLQDVLECVSDCPDLVISVGGDGTMLQSVHEYLHHDCCFVGVHTGTLGFFTDYKKKEVTQLIEDIKNNHYKIIERNLLDICVKQENKQTILLALNEMRFDHDFTTQVVDVYINDELLEKFRGNGLCVSTPSGSTAYNKSLGGAVIYPGYPLMQLTEVAGIQHNAYRSLGSSLILDEHQRITMIGRHFQKVFLAIDHLSYAFDDVKSIDVAISKKTIRFVEYKEMSFVKRVRRAYISE